MSDHREYSYYPDNVREGNMQLLVDETYDGFEDEEGNILPTVKVLSAHYEVCPDCNGKGKYVNPSIDSHGISAEEFYEDPDFAESYCSGLYDIVCRTCHGNNVILFPSTEEGKKIIIKMLQEESNYRAEIEAERRMGC